MAWAGPRSSYLATDPTAGKNWGRTNLARWAWDMPGAGVVEETLKGEMPCSMRDPGPFDLWYLRPHPRDLPGCPARAEVPRQVLRRKLALGYSPPDQETTQKSGSWD